MDYDRLENENENRKRKEDEGESIKWEEGSSRAIEGMGEQDGGGGTRRGKKGS